MGEPCMPNPRYRPVASGPSERPRIPAARTRVLESTLLAALLVLLAAIGLRTPTALPAVGWILATVAAFLAARTAASHWPRLPAALVLVGAAGIGLIGAAGSDLFDRLEGPLGYSNATAAFAVVATAAALVVRARTQAPLGRVLLLLVASLTALVPPIVASRTGTAAVVLVLLAAVPMVERTSRRHLAVIGAVTVTGIVAASILLATVARPAGRILGVADRAWTPSVTERIRLWREGVELFLSAPMAGVGLGRFGPSGTPARAGFEHYAHNEYLQVAAETGLLGLTALVAVLAWLAHRLAAPDADPATTVGLLLMAGLGTHAALDHVLHIPAVALAAAVTLGGLLNRRRTARPVEPPASSPGDGDSTTPGSTRPTLHVVPRSQP